MIARAVYILCAVTAFACTVLLFRGWRRTRVRLLIWAALCFASLTLNNVLLYLDAVVLPDVDLSLWRTGTAVAGVAILVFGLVWDGTPGPERPVVGHGGRGA